jgi:hypothetical protein
MDGPKASLAEQVLQQIIERRRSIPTLLYHQFITSGAWSVGRQYRGHARPPILVAVMRSQKHSGPGLSSAAAGFQGVGLHYITFSGNLDCKGNACPGCDTKDRSNSGGP